MNLPQPVTNPDGISLPSSMVMRMSGERAPVGGGSGRNLAERLQWSVEEDAMIVASVREHGCKWRFIASKFHGRSDDAVRNRYNRVKDLPVHNGGKPMAKPTKTTAPPPKPKPPPPAASATSNTAPVEPSASATDQARVSWSRQEDETIVRSVNELGNKWHKIAARLPGRTEHAIRNRFSRLQSLASRGKPILISSGHGLPIGIQLIPGA